MGRVLRFVIFHEAIRAIEFGKRILAVQELSRIHLTVNSNQLVFVSDVRVLPRLAAKGLKRSTISSVHPIRFVFQQERSSCFFKLTNEEKVPFVILINMQTVTITTARCHSNGIRNRSSSIY